MGGCRATPTHAANHIETILKDTIIQISHRLMSVADLVRRYQCRNILKIRRLPITKIVCAQKRWILIKEGRI